MRNKRELVHSILKLADIEVGGNRPWDICVYNEGLYERVLNKGSVGLGESYMEGDWDSRQLDEFFNKVFSANLEKKVLSGKLLLGTLKSKLFNRQNRKNAFDIGEKHYDAGNDLYRKMLDNRMVYTCGYWKDTDNLQDAQEAKLDLVCNKIGLKAGMRVLDIGCGWGSFAKYAAEKYDVEVVGITVSKEQVSLGKKLCESLPVDIRFQDYRDVNEKFDRIVSLGMFEHVGPKNYQAYISKVKDCLGEDGLFLLHTIGGNFSRTRIDKWVDKYIFPNAVLPSVRQISKASEGKFVLRDWHSFGGDYDKTLIAWNENFQKAWPKIRENYDEKFKRMWEYYLLASAGNFRAGRSQLWQI
ncbi:MAG: cyclopropane fatty acyl phospholipid synthase, partial [Nanoarchaeota archaeon]|nr:cyclopropane fatty acyl phospholipid synthase [Nanoarchaeota archaeon]